MSDDDDKVTPFPVKPREPFEDGRSVFEVIRRGPCDHRRVQYLVAPGESEVECGGCGAKLDPMFVLNTIAAGDSLWMQTLKRRREIDAELEKRTRTKCEHCNRMTRIRR